MYDELTDVLDRSAPPVAGNPAIDAEVERLTRAVVTEGRRPKRSRRGRLVLGGAAVALVVGSGAAAAGSLVSELWGDTPDVKIITDPEGVTCEVVFTVSNGVAEGRVRADRREARRVARELLATFEYSPEAVADELANNGSAYATTEPPLTSADDEVAAQLRLADRAVQRELTSRGLPEVNIAAESLCGQARHQ